ncbi:MAG: hypothetical protein ACOCV2_08265 [Persicimonas sp.]
MSCSANKSASEADEEAMAEDNAPESDEQKSKDDEEEKESTSADEFGLEDGEEPTVVVTVGMEAIEVDGESVVDLEDGQLEDADEVESTRDLRVDALAEALAYKVEEERRKAIEEKTEEGVVAVVAEPLVPYVTLYRVLRTASSEMLPERFAVRIGERPAFAYLMSCKDRTLPGGRTVTTAEELKDDETTLGSIGKKDDDDGDEDLSESLKNSDVDDAFSGSADSDEERDEDGEDENEEQDDGDDESGGQDEEREVVDKSDEGEEAEKKEEDADRCAKPPSPSERKHLRFDLMADNLKVHRMGWSEPSGGFWTSRAPAFGLEEDAASRWAEAREKFAGDAEDEALAILEEVEASYPWSKLSEPLSHFDKARDEGTGKLMLMTESDAPVALIDRAVRLKCLEEDALEEGDAPPADEDCDVRAGAVEFLYFPGRQ